jgi:hypothetical protein
MTSEEAKTVRDAAAQLAQSLNDDIRNASTRLEHIRLTQHAAQAEALVNQLDLLSAGDFPTH